MTKLTINKAPLRLTSELSPEDILKKLPFYTTKLRLRNTVPVNERFKLSYAHEIVPFVKAYFRDRDHECLVACGIDASGILIGLTPLYSGSRISTCTMSKDVFKPLMLMNAFTAIIAQYRPTSHSTTHQHDLSFNAELSEAGNLLGIPLWDHILLADDGYTSLKDLNRVLQDTNKRTEGKSPKRETEVR